MIDVISFADGTHSFRRDGVEILTLKGSVSDFALRRVADATDDRVHKMDLNQHELGFDEGYDKGHAEGYKDAEVQ